MKILILAAEGFKLYACLAGTSLPENTDKVLQLAGSLVSGPGGEGGSGGGVRAGGWLCRVGHPAAWLCWLAFLGSSDCATLSPWLLFVGWACTKLRIWSAATLFSVFLG